MLCINRERFGRNLRAVRESRSLSVYGVARLAGLGVTQYLRWERGLSLPGLDLLCVLCGVLDCCTDDLLAGAVDLVHEQADDGPEGAA